MIPAEQGGEDAVDVERMREFVELSRTMSFTRAAQALHMTQPNLSKHVRDMERELGVTLVERGGFAGGGVSSLTIAGTRFLDYAQKAVADYDAIAWECRRIERATPPLRIQDVHHVVNVVSQLRALMAAKSGDGINYAYVAYDGPAQEALEENVLDVAVVLESRGDAADLEGEFPSDTYGAIPLAPEPLLVMVGARSPLYSRGSVTLAEIADCRIMRGYNWFFDRAANAIAEVFERQGCPLSFFAPRADFPYRGGAYPLEADDVNLCTERFVQYYRDLDVEDFSALRVEGFDPLLYPFLIFRRDNGTPAVRALAESLEEGRPPAEGF